MSSIFEVRPKAISADDLQLSLLNFIQSARRLQSVKQPMRKAKQADNSAVSFQQDLGSAVTLPKLVVLELEIFSSSIERNNFREQNLFCETHFTRVFKFFHGKRKQFTQSCKLKVIYKERCEAIRAECIQTEYANQAPDFDDATDRGLLQKARDAKTNRALHGQQGADRHRAGPCSALRVS